MRLGVDLSILNQKGTPAFYSDIFANRPTYGFAGRVFISTDTGAIYEDTGTSWTLIADAGAGTTGTLQQVTTNGNTTTQGLVVTAGNVAIGTATAGAPLDIHGTGTIAQFNGTGTNNAYTFYQNAGTSKWRVGNFYNAGANSYDIHDSASAVTRLSIRNTGELSITGFETISNTPTFASSGNYASNPSLSLTIPASSTFNSGASYSGMATSLLNSWGGNNTISNGAVMAGFVGVNRQSFNAAGYTVTLTQGSNGVRAVCGMQVLQQTGGSFNGTITHGASLLVQGVYPTSGATVTYTNYYGLLINQLDEYGGVTFTNRWGIYQGGSTDKNYFNGNVLLGSTTDNGSKLQVTGAADVNGTIQISGSGNWIKYDTATAFFGSASTISGGTASQLGIRSGSDILFATGGATERMRITSSGNVGVGSSTPNGKFNVSNNGAEGIELWVVSTTATNLIQSYNRSTAAWNSLEYKALDHIFYGSGTERFRIANGGTITVQNLAGTGSRPVLADASGNLSAPVSDISVKENIVPIGYGLNEILKMKPVWFDFIDEYKNYGSERQNGNIAQDMEQIIPEAVFITPNTEKMGINYDQLHAVYIKAIQELNEKLVRNNIN